MANPFVHVELMSKDIAKSKEFYSALFDWELEPIPGMDYTLIQVGEGVGGGMMPKPDPGIPDNWLAYVAVDDIRAATEKAQSLGATVLKEVTEIPGMGWFSVIADPTGAAIAMWQPAMEK
jgi:hypothetical protein